MAIASKIVKLPSRGGRWLAAVAAVICIGSDVGYFATGSTQQGLRLAPLFALIILAFWLAFWAPRIDISPTDVTVVNPFRTYRIPWSALESVENRWVLVLVTSNSRISAWAAPRQRSGVSGIEVRRDSYGLPDFGAEQQFERQSAPVAAGEVAERLISRRLAERGPDDGTDAGSTVTSRIHVWTLVGLGVLLVASIVTLSLR